MTENPDNNKNSRKRPYKKTNWSTEEESLLIFLWNEHIDELRGSRKNSHIYKEISSQMATSGFNFSSEEVKFKIHNLTNKYKEEKRKIGPSGGSPSSWIYYERIHAILGSFRSNSIELVMDESIQESQLLSSYSGSVIDFEIEALEELDGSLDILSQDSMESPAPKRRNFSEEDTSTDTSLSMDTPVTKRKKNQLSK